MKKMMLTAVVSLFAACGGAPVEENTAESQEALTQSGRCELHNGLFTGYCITNTCVKAKASSCVNIGSPGAGASFCSTIVSSRVCSF